MSNFYKSMYGNNPNLNKPKAEPVSKEKMAGRVIGGLKAQGVHTRTLEIDGQYHTFPTSEYVSQLEVQLKEARSNITQLQNKQNRLINTNNRIMEKIREIEIKLANKLDAR